MLSIDAEPLLQKLAALDESYARLAALIHTTNGETSTASSDEHFNRLTEIASAREDYISELAVFALVVRISIERALRR